MHCQLLIISPAEASPNTRLIHVTVFNCRLIHLTPLGFLTDNLNLTCPKLNSCSFSHISDPICLPILSTKSSKCIQILTTSLHLHHYHSGLSYHHFPPGLLQSSPNRFPCSCLWFPTHCSQNSSQSNPVEVKSGPPLQSLPFFTSNSLTSLSTTLPSYLCASHNGLLAVPQTRKPHFHFTAFVLAVHSVR